MCEVAVALLFAKPDGEFVYVVGGPVVGPIDKRW